MIALRRIVTILAVCAFVVAAVISTLAQTQPQTQTESTRRVLQPASRAQAPAPATSVQTLAPGLAATRLTAKVAPTFPPLPKRNGKTKPRVLKSLNGSTIALSALANACFPTTGGGTIVTDDTILQPGCNLTWTPTNLNDGYNSGVRPVATYTDYYLAPNATTATQVGTAGYLAAAATGHALTGLVAGTYIFGTYDTVNAVWVALLYVQVGSIVALDTYSDNQLTTFAESSAVGATVYIQATGLTPQHNYTVSIEETGTTGQCVFIAPNTMGTTSLTNGPSSKLCNVSVTNTSGSYAPGNTLTYAWTPTAGVIAGYQGTVVTFAPGAYAISLYDQTANQRVAQHPIAITSNVNTGPIPVIQFFGNPGTVGSTTPNANQIARIAWNGGSTVPHYDSSNNFLNVGIGAINLPTATPAGTPKFVLSITDPNGKVVATSVPATASGSLPASSFQPALPTTTLDFAGEYPTSTWTAGILRQGQLGASQTAPVALAVRGFKVLSYAGTVSFVLTSGGTQSSLVLPTTPTGTGYFARLQYANVGDTVVGFNNADPIKEFKTTFPNKALAYLYFYDASDPTGASACKATNNVSSAGMICSQTVIKDRTTGAVTGNFNDSAGHPWKAAISCTSGSIPSNQQCGEDSQFFLDLTPVDPTQPLRPGTTLVPPDVVLEEAQASNPCPTSCAVTSQVYPVDGFGLSSGNKVINDLSLIFGAAGTSKMYGNLFFYGYGTGAPPFTIGSMPSGYSPRAGGTAAPTSTPAAFIAGPQAVLANGQPFATTGKLVFALQVSDQNGLTNNTNDYVQSLSAQFPAGFDATSATVYTKAGAVYTAQTMIAGGTGGCPSGNVCWTGPGNTNLLAATGSTSNTASVTAFNTYYIEINQPTKSFSYTDIGVSVIQGSVGTIPVRDVNKAIPSFVGSPSAVDAITVGAYSLNASEILGTLNPTTIGAGVSGNLTFSLQNTTQSLDPFPDYLDAYVVELPNNGGSSLIAAGGVPANCSTVSVNTANWSCIQVVAGATFNTYWFAPTGCSELYNGTLPPTGAGVAGGSLPATVSAACRTTLQSIALGPGGQNSVTFPITTSGATPAPTASPLAVTAYAHGANTNAWSNPIVSALTVSTAAQASAGFSNAGPYTTGTPSTVASGSQPTVVNDTDLTNGDSYIYTIKNVGNVVIKSAVITVPHLDSSGSTNGKYWTITSGTAPTVTGGNGSCTIAYTSATASSDGNITIAGASCQIATNQSVNIRFNALSPGAVNSTYNFTTKVTDVTTAVTTAQEQWFSDTSIKIALSASLVISVNASATCALGSTGPITQNVGTNTIDFGILTASTTDTCTHAVQASVYTNAAKPVGWTLYAQITGNVAAVSAPSGLASELSIRPSATGGGFNPTQTYLTYGANTFDVAAGSGSAGLAVAHSDGTGPAAAATAPFVVTTDLQLSAGTETIPYTTANVIFTWISS